jgi:hypothetical protein
MRSRRQADLGSSCNRDQGAPVPTGIQPGLYGINGGGRGLPSEARSVAEGAHRRACGAMVGILRLNHERRMVDLTGIEPVTS